MSYVRELHAAMVRSQESITVEDSSGNRFETMLLKGTWKVQPNFPRRDGTEYQYCPPERVQEEMERLVSWHLHHMQRCVAPEVEAAWLHHRFTQIHPFQDGNGRVARALATLVLIRARLFPMVVGRDDKGSYLDSLEKADQGDLHPLVYYIARGQQARFRKAMRVAAQGSRASRTVQEALARYAETIELRDTALQEGARKGMSILSSTISQIAGVAQRGFREILQANDITASMAIGISGPEEPRDDIRDMGKNASVPIRSPIMTVKVLGNANGFEARTEIVTARLDLDPEERLVTFAAVYSNGQGKFVESSPRYWNTQELTHGDLETKVKAWLEPVLASSIDAMTRLVP